MVHPRYPQRDVFILNENDRNMLSFSLGIALLFRASSVDLSEWFEFWWKHVVVGFVCGVLARDGVGRSAGNSRLGLVEHRLRSWWLLDRVDSNRRCLMKCYLRIRSSQDGITICQFSLQSDCCARLCATACQFMFRNLIFDTHIYFWKQNVSVPHSIQAWIFMLPR